MKLYQLLFLSLLFHSCVTSSVTNPTTAKSHFRDYESRTDELTGETIDYYSITPYFVKNSRNKISLDQSSRKLYISFANKFDQRGILLNENSQAPFQFKESFAVIEYHSSLSEGNGIGKMYLEIDGVVQAIKLDVIQNQNKAEEKIENSSMTTMQHTTINIPASTETKFNHTTNQFETIEIPARTETVASPVTTHSQSARLSQTIFNQFHWTISTELSNSLILAKTLRLKLHQENNDFWVNIPEYKLTNLKKFLKHDYRE